MESIKRRLSFRKKKDRVPECSKPHQWQEDEKKVREGNCSFQVRYLGCLEVFESRGMQVCEEAVKTLKSQCKGKYQRAILYVSGDALRVVDEISKSMIVDQTIEKVSFCAPDRNHEKGFAYICRDGTTRRWMCHGFLAVKESGERLSHAVGCAFAICLERKQKRDKESASTVSVTYTQDGTSFTRMGSFRQTTLTERITDPQSAILAEPVPVKKVDNPFAVDRPKATPNMIYRQGSFRGFEKLQEASSPFKRSVSLRLGDLPSTLQRQNAIVADTSPPTKANSVVHAPIEEMSPTKEQEDSISQMCQQLTQGLSALASDDPFANAPQGSQITPTPYSQNTSPAFHGYPAVSQRTNVLSNQSQSPHQIQTTVQVDHPTPPLQQTNPWATPSQVVNKRVPDVWSTTTSQDATNPFAAAPPASSGPVTNGVPFSGVSFPQPPPRSLNQQPHAPHIQHARSHSIDTGELSSTAHHWQIRSQQQQQHKPTLLDLAQQRSFQVNGNTSWSNTTTHTSSSSHHSSSGGPGVDPFDVAWAAKATGTTGNKQNSTNATNPFASKSFEVKL